MSYKKSSTSQYAARKIGAWVAGYQCRGQYRIFRNGAALPRSVETVDLIVPIRKDTQLPVGVEIQKKFSGPGLEKRLLVRVPKDRLKHFEVSNAYIPEDTEPQSRGPKTPTEYDQQIDLIRRAVKKLCPTLSVRRGSGTAYSWIEISGSKDQFHNFTDEENKALKDFGMTPGGNFADISPEDRKFYVEKAKTVLGL